MADVQAIANRIVENVERVMVGKRPSVQLTVLGLLCQGHILIEDVPGVGKTMLAKSLSRSVGCKFQRIQFTPDMLPSDVTGVSVFNQKSREFEFRHGPIFAQIVLVDEINRATPKTQSALLESMEERQVTVDGKTHQLESPFMVLATQNPIEYEGTFPLPEAQLDRFLLRIRLGYPDKQEEIEILDRQQHTHPIEALTQAVSVEELREAQTAVKDIYIDPQVKDYIVEIVRRTRQHPDVYLGSSSRGALAIYRLGQARAAMFGRDYVLPDDVKILAGAALGHRIIVGPAARIKDIDPISIVQEIIDKLPVPGAQVQARPNLMKSRRITVFLLGLVALVAALYTGQDIFFNLAYLMGLLLIFSFFWAWISINWVHLSRTTRTRRTQVGRPLEERFIVRNTSFVPKLWLEVRDFATLPGHLSSHVINSLGSRHTYTWRVTTICRERGRYQLGPIRLRTSDPFGLFPMERNFTATSNIVVYPITFDIHQFLLPVGLLSGGDALRRRTHHVTTNASGVRDYAPGDSYGRIHWRSTARRDRLIVKEFELDPLADIWLAVDMALFNHIAPKQPIRDKSKDDNLPAWMKMEEYSLPEATEEYTVAVTASLAQYFLRQDRAVGMLAYGQSNEIVQPDRGERQINRLLETLAVLRAEGQVRIDDVLQAESHLFPRGSTVIVVTPITDNAWATAARQLTRRGLRVVTILINPESFGGSRSAAPLSQLLQASGNAAYLINNGDDIAAALSQTRMRSRYFSMA